MAPVVLTLPLLRDGTSSFPVSKLLGGGFEIDAQKFMENESQESSGFL